MIITARIMATIVYNIDMHLRFSILSIAGVDSHRIASRMSIGATEVDIRRIDRLTVHVERKIEWSSLGHTKRQSADLIRLIESNSVAEAD